MSALFDKTSQTSIRASAALTDSQVASDSVDVDTWSHVVIDVNYTVGTGGTNPGIELEPLVSDDDTNWTPAESALSAGAPSAGQVAFAVATTLYTRASSGRFCLTFPVYGHKRFRVKVRETGSPSPFGTCAITAARARVNG